MKESDKMSSIEILNEIQDRNLIYPQAGSIAYESIIKEHYPDFDLHLLCDLLGENLFDWSQAKKEYIEIEGKVK